MTMLLDRTHDLGDDGTVRLRLPHVGDHVLLAGLHERLGVASSDLARRRALRFAPGRRFVAVAVRFDGASEQMAGCIGLEDGETSTIADGPAVAALLRQALREHARPRRRSVA
jgi:hypothetical protein